MSESPESKSPLEQALDLFFYAPLGLAITAGEELPKLVEKGRERVTGQVTMARMMGEMVVTQGQKEAGKLVRQAGDRLADMGLVPARPVADDDEGFDGVDAAPLAAVEPDVEPGLTSATSTVSTPAPVPSTNGGGVPAVDQLAIPGYDSLSASQVVQRLAGLSGAELDAVAAYEAATRHRKTILTRISQLQTA